MLIGSLFLLLNIPLLACRFKGNSYNGFSDLLTSGIQPFYAAVFRAKSLEGLTLGGTTQLTFLTIAAGFFIQQISGLLAAISSIVFNPLGRRVFKSTPESLPANNGTSPPVESRAGDLPIDGQDACPTFQPSSKPDDRIIFYSAKNSIGEGHARFKIWLLANRNHKLEWEWEFVNFVIYWGIFTNISVFGLLSLLLVNNRSKFFLFSLLAVWAFALFQSMMRSRTMQNVHCECLMQYDHQSKARTLATGLLK